MNILIYGKRASGKTYLVNALKRYYEGERQHCEVLEDDDVDNPIGIHFLRGQKHMTKYLNKTLHDERKHFIMTTQVFPAEILRPDAETSKWLFDYVCCTEKL
jgi:predicted AAA+ superfamily ATPase